MRIPKGVEQVVVNLKGGAQLEAKRVQSLGQLGRTAAAQNTHLQGATQQNAGFVADHAQVGALFDLVFVLKVHVPLLPLADL